jgi:hypothetical protein
MHHGPKFAIQEYMEDVHGEQLAMQDGVIVNTPVILINILLLASSLQNFF